MPSFENDSIIMTNMGAYDNVMEERAEEEKGKGDIIKARSSLSL